MWVDWIGLGVVGLDWIGLDWIGLDWIGLDWIGLDWIGLDWIGLDWIGLDWVGLDWVGFGLVINFFFFLSNQDKFRSERTRHNYRTVNSQFGITSLVAIHVYLFLFECKCHMILRNST